MWTKTQTQTSPHLVKTKAGNFKLTGAASDGSEPAKAFLINKLGKLMKTSGNYAEASDALAHVLITRKKGAICW